MLNFQNNLNLIQSKYILVIGIKITLHQMGDQSTNTIKDIRILADEIFREKALCNHLFIYLFYERSSRN